MKISEFWKEGNGQLSNTRLHSSVLVFSGCVGIMGAMYMSKLDAIALAACTMLITEGLGSKLIQKPMEKNNETDNPST